MLASTSVKKIMNKTILQKHKEKDSSTIAQGSPPNDVFLLSSGIAIYQMGHHSCTLHRGNLYPY